MVGMMILCVDGFVISVLKVIYLVSFVGSFDRTGDDVGGPFVGL